MSESTRTPAPPAHVPAPRSDATDSAPISGRLVVVASAIAVGIAVLTSPTSLASALMVPLAVVVAVGVTVLAVTRFELFVLGVVVSRATVDYVGLRTGMQLDSLVAGAFTIAGIVWLVATRHRARHDHPPATRAALAFVGAAAIAVVGSQAPSISMGIFARFVTFAVMLLVLDRLLDTRASLRRLVIAFFASAIVPLLVALHELVTTGGTFEVDTFRRLIGTFLHPNAFATYLAFVIVMGVTVAAVTRGRTRLALVLLSGASGVCLIGTYTRGAWIAVAIAVVVAGALRSPLFAAVLVAIGVVIALSVPSIEGRFSDLVTPQLDRTEWNAPPNSFAWRVAHWRQAIELTRRTPVTGAGLGMVAHTEESEAHNDYVRAYAEGGLIGLVTYLWLLGASLLTGLRARRVAVDPIERALGAGVVGCSLVFAIVSLSDNLVGRVVVLWYFAVILAIGNGIVRVARSESGA